uniref:Ig-like domain-containing protein n=1 Tax=Dicentrarchus labrax TaxID=13489 RepID=A0A8P4KU30_DICLA
MFLVVLIWVFLNYILVFCTRFENKSVFFLVSDSVSLHVVPNRVQFFENESLTFHCEGFSGSAGWKLVHQLKGELITCRPFSKETTWSSCTITNVYPDSGEYWCETGEGERTGSVILESPALPVMEGNNVTLSCRNKTTSSNLKADFYKDGLLMGRSSTGEMIIHSVSKSDEGLYKCKISGAGESAESCYQMNLIPLSVYVHRLYMFTGIFMHLHWSVWFLSVSPQLSVSPLSRGWARLL